MPIFLKDGIEIPDVDVLALENDLLDIEKWLRDAIRCKINNCKKRMVRRWRDVVAEDAEVDMVAASNDDFIRYVVSRDDYQDRGQRDKREMEELLAPLKRRATP